MQKMVNVALMSWTVLVSAQAMNGDNQMILETSPPLKLLEVNARNLREAREEVDQSNKKLAELKNVKNHLSAATKELKTLAKILIIFEKTISKMYSLTENAPSDRPTLNTHSLQLFNSILEESHITYENSRLCLNNKLDVIDKEMTPLPSLNAWLIELQNPLTLDQTTALAVKNNLTDFRRRLAEEQTNLTNTVKTIKLKKEAILQDYESQYRLVQQSQTKLKLTQQLSHFIMQETFSPR